MWIDRIKSYQELMLDDNVSFYTDLLNATSPCEDWSILQAKSFIQREQYNPAYMLLQNCSTFDLLAVVAIKLTEYFEAEQALMQGTLLENKSIDECKAEILSMVCTCVKYFSLMKCLK